MSSNSRFTVFANSKNWFQIGIIVALISITSCGYILHPKRVGQTGGQIDPATFALDAVGLLFGILPGVVAFAVDISTGAIYLAPGEQSVIDKHKNRYSLAPSFPSFSSDLMDKTPISPTDEITLNIQRDDIGRQLSRHINSPVDINALQFHRPLLPNAIINARLPRQPNQG